MSQWARNNPEAYERGERYEDGFYDRADRLRQEHKDDLLGLKPLPSVKPCPECGLVPVGEDHEGGCQLMRGAD